MNLLLDTHVVIWALSDDKRLSRSARDAIVAGETVVFVSAVTAWEITIKKALGKLEAPDNYEKELVRHRFTPLDVATRHALAVGSLPPIHEDPFDRLLIAQATVEGLKLVTRDARILRYDVQTLRA